jgi:hypothetical protein
MDQLFDIDRFRETREGSLGHRWPDSTEQMTGHENDGQLRPHHLTLAEEIETIEVRHMYVGDHCIEMALVEFPQSPQSIRDYHRCKVMQLQLPYKKASDRFFIISH